MAETVLVTGATGFTGSHCIRILLEQGYRVKGTVRSLTEYENLKFLYELCPDPTHPLNLVEVDLTDEGKWADVVKGCDFVLHVATPISLDPKSTEEETVIPALQGTLNVLRACRDSQSVKRVVMTSSIIACSGAFHWRQEPFTEIDWADPIDEWPLPYFKSKVVTEKAAWDFVKSLADDEKFELAVMNPGFIIGPSLTPRVGFALPLIKPMMEGYPPMKHGIGVVDVRDLAQAHVNAMHIPAAAGNRHILVADHIWFKDIAELYKEEFGPQGYNINPEECTVNQTLPVHSKIPIHDGTRACGVLGIYPRPAKSALLDMAYAMIEAGQVEKTPGYKGPTN